MKAKSFSVSLPKNPIINMTVIPGHFSTNKFHITHYLDLFDLKSNASIAKDVATELALPYLANVSIDTIVCMEGTEVIGAYVAEELMQDGLAVINKDKKIYVLVPFYNVNRKLMFQSNMQEQILNHNVLLLVSSISSGTTIKDALECISYYGGRVVGISALFNAYSSSSEHEIQSMFTHEDIPGYKVYTPEKCPLCKGGHELDAIIMHDGYTEV